MINDNWIYNGEPLLDPPDGMIGFVYMITNLSSGKRYIGRKNFFCNKIKQKKGKKTKTKVESDWRYYYSSSDELQRDVLEHGTANFKREILYLASMKGCLSYMESKLIFSNGCLESDEWYNNWVSARCHKKHLKKL